MSHQGKADFRSDTVTRPTEAMREAMLNAPVGDDVFGDDPSVLELEAKAAELFGKSAALFLPSGTMANQVACRVHAGPGDEALLETNCHVLLHEQGGLAQLSGIHGWPLAGERGVIPLESIKASVRSEDVHHPRTRLLLLENTHGMSGGSVLPLEYMRSAYDCARENGLTVHVDGARIANAEAASGASLADYGACTDSISCCLSKGLGAPVGSVLAASEDFIAEARRVRKLFGGGMRQAGVLAAPGLIALRDMRSRLVDDHARAAALAAGLARLPGLTVTPPETNIVWVEAPGRAREIEQGLREEGVLAIATCADRMRLVTHLDVNDQDIERALEAATKATA